MLFSQVRVAVGLYGLCIETLANDGTKITFGASIWYGEGHATLSCRF